MYNTIQEGVFEFQSNRTRNLRHACYFLKKTDLSWCMQLT